MQNRVPVLHAARDLPDFDPVPRQCKRHDGWTPERQKAFIEALPYRGVIEFPGQSEEAEGWDD